jgi:hypothetical protein
MIRKITTAFALLVSIIGFCQDLKVSKYLIPNKTTHDFSVIEQANGDVSYTFKLKNTSLKNQLITNVVPECSCTEPTWTEAEILPNQQAEINVGYKASHYPGEFEKKITVYTTQDTFELKILGKVLPKPLSDIEKEYPMQVGALRFQDFSIGLNTIYDNTPKEIEVVFYNDSSKAIYKQKFDKIPAYMRVKFPDTIPAKSSAKLLVAFNPVLFNDYGHTTEYLTLKVGQESKEFSISGNVTPYIPNYTTQQLANAPRMAIDSANTVDLGVLKKDSVYYQKIKIQNVGKSDLTILKIKPACACITTDMKDKTILKPNETQVVNLKFDTTDREGKTKKSVYIYSNDPANPALIFKLIADVK